MAYLPILTYHRVLPDATDQALDPKRISVGAGQFRGHMACLKKWGYQTIGLADYVNDLVAGRPTRKKQCAISFDDGYEEVLTLALPILQEFGLTATVFAVPGQFAGRNAWDNGQARLLSADQYRLLRRGGMTIGAHTSNHVHLPQVNGATAKREIEGSKKELEDILQEPVTTFAYPYGESTPEIEALVRAAGFHGAFATDRAPRDHSQNLFRIRRVVIFPRTTDWELLWKLQRWYPRYQDWKRK